LERKSQNVIANFEHVPLHDTVAAKEPLVIKGNSGANKTVEELKLKAAVSQFPKNKHDDCRRKAHMSFVTKTL